MHTYMNRGGTWSCFSREKVDEGGWGGGREEGGHGTKNILIIFQSFMYGTKKLDE